MRFRRGSQLWPFALEMRGTAKAILGRNEEAIADFKSCQETARDLYKNVRSGSNYYTTALHDAQDLQARCFAGEARTLYQMDRFEEADRVYDRFRKQSFVWTEILFEQAWNSFAKGEYNRTLGKLVSYKSPGSEFCLQYRSRRASRAVVSGALHLSGRQPGDQRIQHQVRSRRRGSEEIRREESAQPSDVL